MPRKQSRSSISRTRASSKKAKAKSTSKANKLVRWSSADDKQLKMLIKQKTPTRAIGKQLRRTEASVRQHAYRMGISLRPTNRSSYR